MSPYLQVGGGPTPNFGDFVGAHFKVSVDGGRVLIDTRETGRPIAFTQVGVGVECRSHKCTRLSMHAMRSCFRA